MKAKKAEEMLPGKVLEQMKEFLEKQVKDQLAKREKSMVEALGQAAAKNADLNKDNVGGRSRGNSSAQADLSFDQELYQKNRPLMAVLVGDDYMDMQVDEGQKISLEFKVEN